MAVRSSPGQIVYNIEVGRSNLNQFLGLETRSKLFETHYEIDYLLTVTKSTNMRDLFIGLP